MSKSHEGIRRRLRTLLPAKPKALPLLASEGTALRTSLVQGVTNNRDDNDRG